MKAYFLSDLHLGAPYFPDSKKTERRVVSFLDSIKHDADTIYLLGDILDYWFEYKYVVPKGFVRFFGKLAELSDSGIRIVWLIGNHDIWIYDYIPTELGIEVYDGSIVEKIDGKNFFMTHGDGVGKLKPSFKFLRKLFRNKVCQKLYSGIHPRWTIPFANNWSRHSRKIDGPSSADAKRMMEGITQFSKAYLETHPDMNYFIFGHLHLLERFNIAPEAEVVVLGDWISKFSYGVWDGKNFELKTLSTLRTPLSTT